MNRSKYSRRRLKILEMLQCHAKPASGAAIAADLVLRGIEASERTVRDDLVRLSEEGAVSSFGRKGHLITEKGRQELLREQTIKRIGFLSAKIDSMTYGMDFDLERCSGTVMVNATVCGPEQLRAALPEICAVFEKGYTMGSLVSVMKSGERIGDLTVPAGKIAFCTVCSITINGILLKYGIPVRSRFGGLLEIRDGQAARFAEAIDYNGTSLDPLVVFIRGGFTAYRDAISTGNGLIGASFREIPAEALAQVRHLAGRIGKTGLGSFLEIGYPGRELMGIPVNEGRAGAVVLGGLNPVSIMEERGDHVLASALSGFMEYERLFRFSELESRLSRL